MFRLFLLLALIGLSTMPPARAESGAMNQCPHYGMGVGKNLALNPSFETAAHPSATQSVAAYWLLHTDNQGSPINSARVTSHAPGPNGARMLRIDAKGVESGVIQYLSDPPEKLMVSAWVFVESGQVQITANGGNTGPSSHSTRTGEWEQLRVCTDGTVPTGLLTILNQAPGGGRFYVDRVEAVAIPY